MIGKEIDLAQLKYKITAFRTKKSYLIFQLVQLILSLIIVIVALTSKNHFKSLQVFILQIFLILIMAFDLIIIRRISEDDFCQKKMNIFDIGVLIIFAVTLIFMGLFVERGQDKDYRELIQTDDIIILILVIARYIVQLGRLACAVRNTHTNRLMHKELKNINLNQIDLNQSINLKEMIDADKMVRQKIIRKHQILNEENDNNH